MAKKIPFHRRALPWLFTLIFFIIAPILVFYTAGYRWNPKKGMVEKNGTLILDTEPRGADIFLNGQRIDERTPATLQNVAPGIYSIKMQKDGYHEWEKSLQILPERVTFANEVFLWMDSEPELIVNLNSDDLITNLNYDFIIAYNKNQNGSELIRLEKDEIAERVSVSNDLEFTDVLWDRGGEKAIITGYASNTAKTWLLTAEPLSLAELPAARYHFERTALVGTDEDYKISLNNFGSLAKERHPEDTMDSFGDMAIKKLPGQENLVLMMREDALEGLILPPGNWYFYSSDNNEILLKDGNLWLRIDIRSEPYITTKAIANALEPATINRETHYLLQNGNELYLWRPGLEPELLYRQSQKILSAGWHPAGYSIYLATENEVGMLNLDNRDGRIQTTLAKFDEIKSAVLVEDVLYISGKKNNKQGIWKLPLAQRSTLTPLSGVNEIINF